MQGNPQVIQQLQAQLKNELTATNQYFLHYRILKHWGLDKLAKKEYEESIGEMKHADKLIARILMLDGLPNLQDLGKLLIGEDVPEILNADLQSERGAQATVKTGIAACETAQDYVSREILEAILEDTEEHIDFLETQIDLLARSACRTTCSRRWASPAERLAPDAPVAPRGPAILPERADQPDRRQRHHQQRDHLGHRALGQVFGGLVPVGVVDAGHEPSFGELVEAEHQQLEREHDHEHGRDLEEPAQVHLAAVARPEPRDPGGQREADRAPPGHVRQVAVDRQRGDHGRGLHAFAPTMKTAKANTAHQPPAAALRGGFTQPAVDVALHVAAHAQHVDGAADHRGRRDPRHHAFPGRRHRADARQHDAEHRRQGQRRDTPARMAPTSASRPVRRR
jgi:bacterioferritin